MLAITTVRFTDIVSQMSETAIILGTSVEEELRDMGPSLIASKAGDCEAIVLEVPEGHEHWYGELEQSVREAVLAIRTATGTPCKLTVCMT